MTQPTNPQLLRLFDLIGRGFQSQYEPITVREIGTEIRELAREMFSVETKGENDHEEE